MRSWWLGLLSGSELFNPIVRLGAGGVCWACPASTYGGYKYSLQGINSSGSVRVGGDVGDVINVMGANRGPLRWRRTCDEDAYFGKLGPS